jgi:uncharacterized protein (TIGR00255 family)
MRSMTGFGTGEAAFGAGKLSVEVRAVNHRFLDVRVRVPREMTELSPFVEQLAREKLTRGRFEIGVRVEGMQLGAALLDRDRARAIYQQLCELRDELAPGESVPLSILTGIPDLFVPTVERESEALREALRKAFDVATKSLDAMRAREGAALGEDLVKRLETVRRIALQVAKRAPDVIEVHRRRLKERAERLRVSAEIAGVDPARLEQEIALFAERVDIAEELTRLEPLHPVRGARREHRGHRAPARLSPPGDGARGQHRRRQEPRRADLARDRRGEGRDRAHARASPERGMNSHHEQA